MGHGLKIFIGPGYILYIRYKRQSWLRQLRIQCPTRLRMSSLARHLSFALPCLSYLRPDYQPPSICPGLTPGTSRAAQGSILEAVFSSTGLKFSAQGKSQWQPFQAPPPTNPRAQRPAIHTYQQLWRSKRRYGEWVGKEKGMGIWMVNCVNLSVAHAPTTNQP